MYRVFLAGLACVAIAGCSLGTKSLSLNLNDQPKSRIDPNFVSNSSLGNQAASDNSSTIASYSTTTKPTHTAMLQADQAPAGSTKKAPAGALADRSYQATALNVADARAMINAYRKQQGLAPVTIDPQLTAAAKAHSIDLAKWDRISHYGSDGSNPWDRVRRAGYSARLAAENVGTGQTTLKEVFAGWKKSPGHNKNLLLKDAKNMGIALVYDAKTEFKTFWTLVLGTKS
jgi:uncharacterized protein YkwD